MRPLSAVQAQIPYVVVITEGRNKEKGVLRAVEVFFPSPGLVSLKTGMVPDWSATVI